MKFSLVYLTPFILLLFCTLDLVNAQNLVFKQKIVPMDTVVDRFGQSMDFESSGFVVGSINGSDANGKNETTNAGAVFVYFNTGDEWSLDQKIVGPLRAPRDFFGNAVKLSLNELFVGAYQKDEFISPSSQMLDVGSAYFLEFDTGSWVLKQTIMSSDRRPRDQFGWSIDRINEKLVISAIGNNFDENGNDSIKGAGAVYYFTKQGSSWNEKQKIVAADRNTGGIGFGRGVYFYENSGVDELFISSGSYTDENGNNSIPFSGAVYYYKLNGSGNWVLEQKIVASDRMQTSQFGFNFQVTSNGKYLFVGANSTTDANGSNTLIGAGAVYVFRKNSQGKWQEIQKITSPHRQKDAFFGTSISVSDSLLAVGSPGDNTDANNMNNLNQSGALYFFKIDKSENWNFFSKLVPPDRSDLAKFGFKTEILYNLLVTTAHSDKSGTNNQMGSVYYYYIDTNTGIGIYELANANDVAIYPNPTSDVINFGSVFPLEGVEIFDSNGMIVQIDSFTSAKGERKLDIRSLSSGLYFAKITGQRGSSIVKSFIKN